jgi:hypothetical protein
MAQEVPQEKRNWKVKKIGPKRMGNKAKEPDSTIDPDGIIEDLIPPSVPIAVEIKNLKTNSLLRDMEIKVTNTANKPIYFLELGIVLPDNLSPNGYPIGFPLRYGRPELIKLENALGDDLPLLPGASFILRIPERNLEGFEKLVAKGKITQAEVKKVYLMFRGLTFGDKTGFSSDGSPVPNIRKDRSANDCYGRKDLEATRSSNSFNTLSSNAFGELTFLRAKFSAGKSPPQSNLCCSVSPPAEACAFVKEDTYYCECGIGRTTTIVGCQDSSGKCSDIFRMIAPATSTGRNILALSFSDRPARLTAT